MCYGVNLCGVPRVIGQDTASVKGGYPDHDRASGFRGAAPRVPPVISQITASIKTRGNPS